jgi:zinc protease
MRTRLSIHALFAAALAVTGSISCSTFGGSVSPATDIPSVAVETYSLPNGLQVILSPDRRLPVVAVNLWYHVGPANEEPGRTGFAHLFEHMMFQSSKHVPQDAHFRLLEAAGASDLNGTTDFDRTNYFATVPSNQLELALWLESDRMGYLLEAVDQAALSNQQDVVREERRESVESRPYGLAEEALVQMLYPQGHPYHGNIIGSHADIQAATLENVQQFFRRYYAPNNASLALVGDFETADARRLVEKYFGTLRRGPDVPAVTVTTPPIAAERRQVVQARVELPRVYMAWLTPPIFRPGDADADIAATILGGGRSSRLYEALVYEKQIAQDVSAWQYSLTLGSIFQITATARPGHTAEELEQALDDALASLRAQPPAEHELEQARNTIETDIVTGLERVGGLANRLNSYNHYAGTPDYLQQDVERYRTVTRDTVQAFVREQLAEDARVVLHVVPGEPAAPVATVAPVPQAAAQASGAGTGGGEAINADEPWRGTPPAPGPVPTVRLPAPASGMLANGLTLILDERQDLPIVAASLVFKTGSGANPLDTPGLANFVAAMLDEGTTMRNALEIADQVAQLGGSLSTGSSMDATTVSGRSLAKNFPAILDLMADVVLRPSFPAEEIERQRASRLGQLAQQRDDPSQVASRVTAAALFGERHPYGFTEIGTESSVTAMSRDDMVAFWRQHVVPNNAALLVSGDISIEELRALAEAAFSAWERGAPVRPAVGRPTTTGARVVIVDRPDAAQTQVRVAALGAPRSSPDFRPMQVMNMALGGLFSSRLNLNLREEHGYTYGASSYFLFRRDTGAFQAASGVRTEVTAPAVVEMLKEIRGMTEAPASADELRSAKTAMINSLPGAFETTFDAVGNFSNVYVYDLGLDYYTTYAADVEAVTAEQGQAMARKYLAAERLLVVLVGDRAEIEPGLRKLNLGAIEIRDADGERIP